MTVLPSQTERDSLNIDSYERAILWAAMLLREAVLTDADANNQQSIRIFTNQREAKNEVVIEGQLPYVSSTSWLRGGEFFGTVPTLATKDPSGLFSTPTTITPSISFVPLPAEPAWVMTLENYFLWAIKEAKAHLATQDPPNYGSITYRFFDSRDPATLEFRVALPFDLPAWLRDRHFFNSLKPLMQVTQSNLLTNDSLINNDLLLIN